MVDFSDATALPKSREENIAAIGATIERLVIEIEAEGFRIYADLLGQGIYIGFPDSPVFGDAYQRFHKLLDTDRDVARAVVGYLMIHRPALCARQ